MLVDAKLRMSRKIQSGQDGGINLRTRAYPAFLVIVNQESAWLMNIHTHLTLRNSTLESTTSLYCRAPHCSMMAWIRHVEAWGITCARNSDLTARCGYNHDTLKMAFLCDKTLTFPPKFL